MQYKEQQKYRCNSVLYLEGCILGVGAPEAVKYCSDVDTAPELYNLYNLLQYLYNVGARPAPSLYAVQYTPLATYIALYMRLSISRPLQINFPP